MVTLNKKKTKTCFKLPLQIELTQMYNSTGSHDPQQIMTFTVMSLETLFLNT